MRPSIGFATIKRLEAAGCEVLVPTSQTCCGQPAFNSGDRESAKRLARKVIEEFAGFDYVVAPSASCADQIINEYPKLLADEAEWAARARDLASRTRELCQFLSEHLENAPLQLNTGAESENEGLITYHDSCTGLRSLGIKSQPRDLLQMVAGQSVTEMNNCEECCGFGGSFAVKFGDISAAIAGRKCEGIIASGAKTVAGGDLGCLLNIEGKLRRMGHHDVAVRHIAEILAEKI